MTKFRLCSLDSILSEILRMRVQNIVEFLIGFT